MSKKVFKILSIDGGGIKGLYSSSILQCIEEYYDCSLSDYFDLICGTSTGGLIALGISQKISCKEISNLYINHGSSIFPKGNKLNRLQKIYHQWMGKGKYKVDGLKIALEDTFGDAIIGSSNNLLCIPSFDAGNNKPRIFKYDHKFLEGTDNQRTYVEVGLATSAAPTFLPPAKVYDSDKLFVDGGVWGNNPSLFGLSEALEHFVGPSKEYDDIMILSISSLEGKEESNFKSSTSSIMAWGRNIITPFLVGQSFFSHHFLKIFSESNVMPTRYVRIPSLEYEGKLDLDSTDDKTISIIRDKGVIQGRAFMKTPQVKAFMSFPKTYWLNQE